MIKLSVYKELQGSEGRMELDVSLEIQAGTLVSLFGSSGAGKTTVLRLIAGLTAAKRIYLEVDGAVWNDSQKKIFLPVHKRSIGFVFQDFALFPNFTLRENIEYALPKTENKKRVDEIIESLELGPLQKNKPVHLSGGQKQRVALARAIARKPKLLLLDEPLSSLDNVTREKLQDYLATVHKEFGCTTILVSHHLADIYKLSDKVFCIEKGKIVKSGKLSEVFAAADMHRNLRITGEIISFEKNDDGYVVTILSGQQIVKVPATPEEIKDLKPGGQLSVVPRIER